MAKIIITIILVNIVITIMSGPYDQLYMCDLFKDSDTYQIYISYK